MPESRPCRTCGVSYPLDRDHFGHQPNGNFRYTCRKCMATRTRQHYEASPEFQAGRIEMRRQRDEAAGGISKWQLDTYRRALIKKHGSKCFYCGNALTFRGDKSTLDHKTPLVKRGTNAASNFVLACFKCNMEKHNKTVEEYRVWLLQRGYKPRFK
jgi:5-methylcytosine-specific restriction endonuclease McrA